MATERQLLLRLVESQNRLIESLKREAAILRRQAANAEESRERMAEHAARAIGLADTMAALSPERIAGLAFLWMLVSYDRT